MVLWRLGGHDPNNWILDPLALRPRLSSSLLCLPGENQHPSPQISELGDTCTSPIIIDVLISPSRQLAVMVSIERNFRPCSFASPIFIEFAFSDRN